MSHDFDVQGLISKRSRGIDASGIRRVFDLGAKLSDPINLSIGQPDFPVPEAIQQAAIEQIRAGANGYTVTQGVVPLRKRLATALHADIGWTVDIRPQSEADASKPGVLITSGTSGGILLALLAVLDPGDEIIFGDPYFAMYPHVTRLVGAVPVICDTYPDFRLTAERVRPLITTKTKAVLVNTPGNPAGSVLSQRECRELSELCRSKGILLISDEIYDEFTYPDAREASPTGDGAKRCPSPAREPGAQNHVLLVRGFGKTYGMTGWRLGYATGPRAILEEMAKLQQYTFVCAPSALQFGAAAALDVDMTPYVDTYRQRRDYVQQRLGAVTNLIRPGGAFYAFVPIPERLAMSATQFIERCLEHKLLVIPGNVFSRRDTHFRLSYATNQSQLERGMDVLVKLMS